jgi:hypothetical protein
MDTLIQLITLFSVPLAIATIALAIYWPIWTFLAARRVCRDLHSIAESLQWIAYAQRKVAESEQPLPKPAMISQFGR